MEDKGLDESFNIDKKWVEKKLKKRGIKTDNGFDIKADLTDFEDPMNVIDDIAESFEGSSCEVIKIADREEAVRYAVRNAQRGDMIVFAGKGHEKYQLINGEKLPFDEVAIATDEARKIMEERELLA